MSRLALLLVNLTALLGLAACGNPKVTLPAALEVSWMPLDGAIEVEPDVEVAILFSGEVDPDSVNSTSILLERSAWDSEAEACGDAWTATGWTPAVVTAEPSWVQIGSDQDRLDPGACYRIVCTTKVRGVELGPLPDLGMPGQSGVGAEASFRTRL
jgi:hypothetical protein